MYTLITKSSFGELHAKDETGKTSVECRQKRDKADLLNLDLTNTYVYVHITYTL